MELQSVPLLSILIWLIQLALIIHVLKTGRSRYWILMLLFMPAIGGLAYLVIEIIPEFSGSMVPLFIFAIFLIGLMIVKRKK